MFIKDAQIQWGKKPMQAWMDQPLLAGHTIYAPKILEIYRSGTGNSKSFVSKVLLRIKWKFELN